MTIMPEISPEIRSKIEKILGNSSNNKLKNLKKQTKLIGGLLIFIFLLGVIILKNNWANNTLINNQNANQGENLNQISEIDNNLGSIIRSNTQVEVQLPRKNLGETLQKNVYATWMGEVTRKGLGSESKIVDGFAHPRENMEFNNKFGNQLSDRYILATLNINEEKITQTSVGFYNEDGSINNKNEGSWIGNLSMPIGTASIAIFRDNQKVDQVYVKKELLKIDLLPISANINFPISVPINANLNYGELPIRIALELDDTIRRKNIILQNFTPINSKSYQQQIVIDRTMAIRSSIFGVGVYLSTPFEYVYEKTNTFTYRF